MTVEPRAVDPHCFDADPKPDPNPAQNLDADPDPDPDPDPRGGGEGVGQPKLCIPPGKILGTPLSAMTKCFLYADIKYHCLPWEKKLYHERGMIIIHRQVPTKHIEVYRK